MSTRKLKAPKETSAAEPIDDPISVYLDDISHISLLTREKELSLARKIEAADLAVLKLDQGNLTPAEVKRCQQDIEQGHQAREELINANYRLVISIAKKYVRRDVSLMDLIQEGNIGLIKAADRFDHRRGYKFSTYATWWIRQAVSRAVTDQGRTIRIPVHMCERINRLARVSHQLTQFLRRRPTLEEVAAEMNTTCEEIKQIRQIARRPLSLEMPVREERERDLGDFIEDDNLPPLPDIAAHPLLQDSLDTLFASLNAREGRVLQLRFGLYDGKPHTLEEVGQKFGVSRERVRQIESAALDKLRRPELSRALENFLA
jgi:RNA polymerase primary sigma factor